MESEPVQTQDVVEVVEPVAQEPVQNQDAQEPVQNQDAKEPVSQEPVQNQDVVEEPVQNQDVVEEPVQNQNQVIVEEPVQNQNQDVVEEPVQNQNQDVVEEPVQNQDVEEPVQNQDVVEEPVQNQNQDVVEVVEPVSQEPVQNQDVVEEPVSQEPVSQEPVQNQDVVEEPVSQEPVQTQDVVEEPAPEIIIPTTHKEIDSLNLFFIMKHCMSEMLLIRAMHSMLHVVPDAWSWAANVDITNVNEGVDPMFDAIQHHMNEQTDFKRDVTWELRKNAFVWIIRQLNYIAKHGVPQYKTLYANYNPTMDIEGLWVQSEAGI
jgi:hypothetical protein